MTFDSEILKLSCLFGKLGKTKQKVNSKQDSAWWRAAFLQWNHETIRFCYDLMVVALQIFVMPDMHVVSYWSASITIRLRFALGNNPIQIPMSCKSIVFQPTFSWFNSILFETKISILFRYHCFLMWQYFGVLSCLSVFLLFPVSEWHHPFKKNFFLKLLSLHSMTGGQIDKAIVSSVSVAHPPFCKAKNKNHKTFTWNIVRMTWNALCYVSLSSQGCVNCIRTVVIVSKYSIFKDFTVKDLKDNTWIYLWLKWA